jgi:uncharacterized repeat protein (TIGR03803 family)
MTVRTIANFFHGSSTGSGTQPLDWGHLAIDANGDLFGTTVFGGNSASPGDGLVFEITDTNGTYAGPFTLYSFTGGSDGANPHYGLLMDSAGDLFGSTPFTALPNNGTFVPGTVFELEYANGVYTQSTLYTLPSTGPKGDSAPTPIMDSAGNLFGVTAGSLDDGTIFEIADTNGTYAAPTTLYSFTGGSDGGNPDGPLIMDAAGDLFGTTSTGGANGDGTVFEVKKTNGVYAAAPTTIASLAGSDDGFQIGGLLMDSAGDLFGTTVEGGAHNDGAVFEIKYQNGSYASTPTILYSFTDSTDGQHPNAGLIMDAAGDLFGTANEGPGAADDSANFGSVFALKAIDGGYVEFTLADFGADDNATSGLTVDAAGDLFGTVVNVSAGASDFVYEIPADGATIASVPKTLATFGGASTQEGAGGGGPYGGLVMDHAGNLFGTTTDGSGSVFEIAYAGGGNYAATATTIAAFSGSAANPLGNLIMDANGDLFGTTATGGASGKGSVFEIKFANGSYTSTPATLYSFTGGADGQLPYGGLVMDANGDLFGTTSGGEAGGAFGGPTSPSAGSATVFEIKATNGTYASTPTTLYTFPGGNNYSASLAGLIMDAAGDLFGTSTGGFGVPATVFEIKFANGSYASTPTVLASFSGDTIGGGLVMDAAGDLFGVTGSGTVFELKNNNGSYSSPITLATGLVSDAGLTIDAKGDLFGTDVFEGAYGFGWVFEIKDNNGTYASSPIDIGDFAGNNQGAYPTSTLILDQLGDLFGTTEGWSTHDNGTVFEIGNVQFVVACFRRGTLIEIARGLQRKVEDLKIGDKLRTASGALRPIKWIGRRSYAGRFIVGRKNILPVCFKAGSLGDNVPERDLWISPQHAMYFASADHGGVLIEAKDLINGTSIVQPEHTDSVEYFHIELDSHDVIVAEGALSETFIDDDSRGIFHNAHEFDTLYAEEPPAPAHYCAPRLSEGYEVEAVRQRLMLRAELVHDAGAPHQGTPQIGALRGYIDCIRASIIAGWAQNTGAPEAPVCLDIFADGKFIGRVLANIYREDLKAAGLGSGRHAFQFTPPVGLVFAPEAIEVRRSLDGARLDGSSALPDVRLRRCAAGA